MKTRARRIATAVVVVALGCPTAAWAAIRIDNPVRSGVAKGASCIVQEPGGNALTFATDATGPYLAVNSATSVAGNTTLLQTTITAEGYPGERTVYADILRIRNTCLKAGIATISIGPDVAGVAAATGPWTDLNMSLHLSAIAPPITTADLANTSQWNATSAVVTAGTVTTASSGSVAIPAGSRIQIALVVDAGTSVSTATPAELRFVTTVAM